MLRKLIYRQPYIAFFAIIDQNPFMDTKALRIFQHLARNLHFAKTANTFHMSPSTLTRLVQRMEEQVGCQLLLRDNRSVRLSEGGKKLLDYADQQLAQWQALKIDIDKQKEHLTGKLHIFCSVTASYSHLPPLVDHFRQQYTDVELIITTGDAADAIKNVQNNSVDIAIAAKPEKISNKLYFSPIADIPLSVIAPSHSNEIKNQLRKHPINWKNIPIILPDHGPSRTRFDRWFNQKQAGKPNIYATVSGHEALVSLVALGCGIGITPKVVVENSPVKNRVEYIDGLGQIEPFELGICCLTSQTDQPIVQAFFATINTNESARIHI